MRLVVIPISTGIKYTISQEMMKPEVSFVVSEAHIYVIYLLNSNYYQSFKQIFRWKQGVQLIQVLLFQKTTKKFCVYFLINNALMVLFNGIFGKC